MDIELVDVDGHSFPNIALMKIASWHRQRTLGKPRMAIQVDGLHGLCAAQGIQMLGVFRAVANYSLFI